MVTDEEREHFSRWGYVVLHDVLSPMRDLAPVWGEWQAILDGVAETLYQSGEVSSTYRELPLAPRMIALTQECRRSLARYLDPSLPERGLLERPALNVGPAMFGLLRNEAILDLVQEFVGKEIYSNPIQHVRVKYPSNVLGGVQRTGLTHATAWHQDSSVATPDAAETELLTVWIPLTSATAKNGCMQLIPGSHLRGQVDHCPAGTGYFSLTERALDGTRVALPMEPGSVLLMHKHTMHASLENDTDDEVRMSLDLRYQPIGQATGRRDFPGFVARSGQHPDEELRDPAVWANRWLTARELLYRSARDDIAFRQWSAESELCA